MKIQIKGFINYKRDDYDPKNLHGMHFYPCDMSEFGYVAVMPCSFEVEIPDNFNPITAQVAILEKQKRELQAKFAVELMHIEDGISKLTCISMDEPS